MRVVIIGLVFVAIILAGGSAYLMRDYLSTQQAEIAALKPKAPTVDVLVAASDLPVGTVVNENNTEWLEWPEGRVPSGFLSRTDDDNPLDAIGADRHMARRSFSKGEPIVMERLYKTEDPGFLRGSLSPGMRAVAVRTSAEVGASGFILPGDRVDLLLTHNLAPEAIKLKGGASNVAALEHTTETILEDLRVLAVDQNTNEFEGGAALAKTILLEVSAKQAEIVYTANAMGNLVLSLRSAEVGDPRSGTPYTTDVEVSPVLGTINGTYSGRAASGAANAAPAPVAAAAPITQPAPFYKKPTRSTKKITVYRGGQAGAAQ